MNGRMFLIIESRIFFEPVLALSSFSVALTCFDCLTCKQSVHGDTGPLRRDAPRQAVLNGEERVDGLVRGRG